MLGFTARVARRRRRATRAITRYYTKSAPDALQRRDRRIRRSIGKTNEVAPSTPERARFGIIRLPRAGGAKSANAAIQLYRDTATYLTKRKAMHDRKR